MRNNPIPYEETFRRDWATALRSRRQQAMSLRTYAAAQGGRLVSGWGPSVTSADTEISSSLRYMRQRSRALTRDAAFGKRGKVLVVNNVVGTGIGMQAQVKNTRGELIDRQNKDVEETWDEWTEAENCHTGGRLHFSAMEQLLMGQVFEAGEVFIRKHYRPFGMSSVPYALEVIEPERVLDEFQPSAVDPRMRVRMGVESDPHHRPVAYWIRTVHPGEMQYASHEVDRIERVPADQIIHLAVLDRWPQTRGVPWMHAAMRKINDTDGYSEAEIIAARGGANYMATRKLSTPRSEEEGVNGAKEMTLEPGIVEDIYEDEEFNFHAPNRPNSNAESFLRFMLREIAAGIGVSYESLSRDYSQSNYSSARLSLLDDRDLWRIIQLWFIRSFRVPVHRDFIQQAVLSGSLATVSVEQYAIDPRKFSKARFKPRGWSWIDPAKEEAAVRAGVKDGFTTQTDVIAKTADGRDIEDILEERAQELVLKKQIEKKYEKYGIKLSFDTDPEVTAAETESKKQPAPPPDNSAALQAIADKQEEDDKKKEESDKENDDRFRMLERTSQRRHADIMKAIGEKQMVLNLGDNIVNIPERQVNVDGRTTVTVPEVPVAVTVQGNGGDPDPTIPPKKAKKRKETVGA
jgi:lambda family phage portal protein